MRLFDIILKQYDVQPEQAFLYHKQQNSWQGIAVKDFVLKGNKLSSGLLSIGIEKGDKIGLICPSRYEWHLLDFAISQIGAVCVPLYTNLTSEEYAYVSKEAELKILFVATRSLYHLVQKAAVSIPVFCIDKEEGIPHYESLFSSDIAYALIEQRRNGIRTQDLATIIYTSGTEGNPKGVMLSHQNIVSNILSIDKALSVSHQDVALSFLPLNHIYEKTITYFFMYVRCPIYYAESLTKVMDNIKEVRPTIFSSIPLLMKKIYDKILEKGHTLRGVQKMIFEWSLSVAKKWDTNQQYNLVYQSQRICLDLLVYRHWRKALGGRINLIASGSAAINPLLIRVFQCAGINLLEGYGLTETSPVVAVNRSEKKNFQIGTVGPLLDKVEARIAPDGEILLKGPNIMLGYFKKPDQTAQVLDKEGWLYTGDIGEIVEGRFLKIVDRKKELFKTSGGKYISPQFIEGKLKESRFIEQSVVVGENQSVVGALIQPNWDNLAKWCVQNHIQETDKQQLTQLSKVKMLFQEQINTLNESLPSHEKIRKYELVPDTWSVSTGELTPTLKIKRRVLKEKYAHLYHKMFGAENR